MAKPEKEGLQNPNSISRRNISKSHILTTTNGCGTDTESIVVVYTPCVKPTIGMITPLNINSQSLVNSTIVKASVLNVNSLSQITLKVNGNVVSGGTFSSSTNIFEKNVSLQAGLNTIIISATNDCGSVIQTITVDFAPCLKPLVQILSPSNELQTQNQSLIFSANVLNITNANQVQLTVNGSVYSPGTYNNNSHVYQKTIALQNGENVITLTATNNCGSSTSTVKLFFIFSTNSPMSPAPIITTTCALDFNMFLRKSECDRQHSGLHLTLQGNLC